jgi:hypothetical protein
MASRTPLKEVLAFIGARFGPLEWHACPGGGVGSVMRGVKKAHLPTKVCPVCGLSFTWRKKWEKTWDAVRYCSERCKRSAKRG